MSRPHTTYPSAEFAIIPEPGGVARQYANVDNRVARYHSQRSNAATYVPIVVPTALFTAMREVFKVQPEDAVTMYLVPDGEYFVFGISWGEDDTNIADLWAYTAATLPTFF